MNIPLPALPEYVSKLLAGRYIASLATTNADGSLHQTAVWYAFLEGVLYVATGSKSRKARNLIARPQAGLMIDTRVPGYEQGVSAAGEADVLTGETAAPYIQAIHARYMTPAALADPVVGPAFAQFDDAVIRLTPRKWVHWDISEHLETLSERLSVPGGYLYPLD